MISESIHEEVLRALVQQKRSARVPGGQDRWWITLETVDPPGRKWCTLGADTLSALTPTYLGQPDSGGAFRRRRGLEWI
jgi:hypothetical protein